MSIAGGGFANTAAKTSELATAAAAATSVETIAGMPALESRIVIGLAAGRSEGGGSGR